MVAAITDLFFKMQVTFLTFLLGFLESLNQKHKDQI